MTIAAITLDWGDTLAVNYGMPYQATQRQALGRLANDLKELGYRPSPTWMQHALNDIAVQWKSSLDPVANPGQREIDMAGMINAWVSAAGASPTDAAVRAAMDRCNDRFTDTVMLYSETPKVLAALKDRGLRIGILSHVPWPGDACRRWFQRNNIAHYIDFYSLSSEIGYIKPHPAHYQHALEQAGCSAGQVLHVGDHPIRDVEGGKRFGFRTCLRWTENIYAHELLAGCNPDAEILQLDELLNVVDRL